MPISNSEKERDDKISDLEERHVYVAFRSHFFRLLQRSFVRRSFFIYRCLPPKTHASHHYKIADYSGIGAAGPFYPFRLLDRPERGIEDGSERSRQSFETEERGRRRRGRKGKRGRGPLIGGIRRPLRSRRRENEAEGAARKNKAIPSGTRVT